MSKRRSHYSNPVSRVQSSCYQLNTAQPSRSCEQESLGSQEMGGGADFAWEYVHKGNDICPGS